MQVVVVVAVGAGVEVDLGEQAVRSTPYRARAGHARPVVHLLGACPGVHGGHVALVAGGVADVGRERGQRPVGPAQPAPEVLDPGFVGPVGSHRTAGGAHGGRSVRAALDDDAQLPAGARGGGDGFGEQDVGQYGPFGVEVTGVKHPPDHVEEGAARHQADVTEPVLLDDEVGRFQCDLCFDAGSRTEH
ncbi:hypothetical protein SHIRM173S_13399 [Streptomyces hirsutus]